MYPLAPVVFDYFRVPQGEGLPIPLGRFHRKIFEIAKIPRKQPTVPFAKLGLQAQGCEGIGP
jgi:hypothetical protein